MNTRPPTSPDEPSDGGDNAAQGAQTLVEILDEARRQGFGSHSVGRDDQVECGNCGQLVNPAALRVQRFDRLEGASDAADEMLVIWAECPLCGKGSTFILGYGPNISPGDEQISRSIDLSAATSGPKGIKRQDPKS